MPLHHAHLLPFLAPLLAALAFLAPAALAAPPGQGVTAERLAPCPETPNCVCSQDAGSAHHVEPLRFSGPPQAALARLRAVLGGMSRCTVVQDQPPYLHAEFRSRVFGFVDDVEFLLEPAPGGSGGVFQVRSAARQGWWDLGANRRRVEEIRARFAGEQP